MTLTLLQKKLLGITVITALAALALIVSNAQRSTFSPSRWQSADLTSRTRIHMVKDLMESVRLFGQSRRQVIELLGPVTDTDKFRDWEMV